MRAERGNNNLAGVAVIKVQTCLHDFKGVNKRPHCHGLQLIMCPAPHSHTSFGKKKKGTLQMTQK